MKKTILIVMALLCLNFGVRAQAIDVTTKGLQIGQEVPEFTMATILNYPDKTISFSKLKDRIVILDFWSSWCGPCVRAMPKLNILQRDYADQIQIILITKDSDKRVSNFFPTNVYAKGNTLALAASNETIVKLFPYIYMPHLIWIGKDGKIFAITEGDVLTTATIDKILTGKSLDLPFKDDFGKKL